MDPTIPLQADLVILGGGINGAGLAALAAHSGLSVALLEKGDFASGTSSKSTKLIHGGIRYLEQANFALVFEALHERSHLLKLAPHLVHPLAFLLPIYEGDRRPAWMLKVGLWLYDLLAGIHNIGRHQWFTPEETLTQAPLLQSKGLKGCGLYYDAQVNDARLVLENILAAEEAGAACLNGHPVLSALKTPKGLFEITYQNRQTGAEGKILARCLVNATGPWANQTQTLLSPGSKPLVRPTRGTHLVVPQVMADKALLITTRKDNRVIFVIPWRGYSLVGTTDLDDDKNPDQTKPSAQEINYLLAEAARLFPHQTWDPSQVLAAFSGLRPLAWTDAGGQASSVSREDKILSHENQITIVGGKLTTYRTMAEKGLKAAGAILKKRLYPASFNLPGKPDLPWERFMKEKVAKWPSQYGVTEKQANHLGHLYGQRAEAVLGLTLKDPRLKEALHPARPEILAQVAYAAAHEKALHLSDVLLRRLEIGYTPYRWGEASEKASRILAEILHWDEARRLEELSEYKSGLVPPV
jgi:glycerol-3-phosphate dehydrogenase